MAHRVASIPKREEEAEALTGLWQLKLADGALYPVI
jgi:hypothetical protein